MSILMQRRNPNLFHGNANYPYSLMLVEKGAVYFGKRIYCNRKKEKCDCPRHFETWKR